MKKIKIIDLFSGPGGLGEGFSNCKKNSPFEIVMSVEAEKNAHKTLTHRAFYRRLNKKGKLRFLDYIQCTNLKEREEKLNVLKESYDDAWSAAQHETMFTPHTLGNTVVWEKIKNGEKITAKDREDTQQQKAISKRVKQIKKECLINKEPLIVIGGPPCQSYSNAGRNRVRAIKGYLPDEDQRFFLYREYCRVLSEAEPEMFIMENVEGILSAKLANGDKIFPHIKAALEKPYKEAKKNKGATYILYSFVTAPDPNNEKPYDDGSAFNIKANAFGIPQKRHRVIILGVRNNFKKVESFIQPVNDNIKITISDLIDSMPELRSGISAREKPTIENTYEDWLVQWNRTRTLQLNKLKASKYIKTKEIIETTSNKRKDKLDQGNHIFVSSKRTGFSKHFETKCEKQKEYKNLRDWIYQPELHGFANHSTKSHQLLDRQIYMFASAWAKAHSSTISPSPKMKDFPGFLAPNHENWESGKNGDHSDRFRCIEASKVSPTITCHLRKDGHAFIHYDIIQNRALTAREAARIQTFPDDYFFEGAQGAQYQQVGNAVPPFLAKKIALHVLKLIRQNGLNK